MNILTPLHENHICTVVVGKFIIIRLPNGKLWIRNTETGEGMELNSDTEKKFEQAVLEFFAENF
jgi:hypothetical protein